MRTSILKEGSILQRSVNPSSRSRSRASEEMQHRPRLAAGDLYDLVLAVTEQLKSR